MYRVLLAVVVIALIGIASAQVNFTPNWGKRTVNSLNAHETENICKESVDTVMLIYKMIQVSENIQAFLNKTFLMIVLFQNEAQKLVECEKLAN